MLELEAGDEIDERRRVDLTGQVDRDAPALSPVADVGAALPGDAVGVHLCIEPAEQREIRRAGVDPAEPHVVPLRARGEQADGREHARERRHDHGVRPQLGRERRGVHRTRAAVREEHELRGIAALLGRDGAERAHHRGVREVVDGASGDPDRLERPLRERAGQLDAPVPDPAFGHQAERDVRVRHRGLAAAAAVARRPGVRARAPRPDGNRSGLVAPRDRAAAGADLGDVDRRDADQLARPAQEARADRERRPDLVLLRPRDAAVLDERGFGGRAAHVEGDRVGATELAGERERRDDAGSGAGLEDVDRALGRLRCRHHASRRLHDREIRFAESAPQAVEVRAHQRADVGVDDGRGRPLVLMLLAEDLRGERDRYVRQLGTEDLPEAALVRGVEVGVQQADANGLDHGLAKPGGDLARLVLVERALHGPVGQHPLADLETEASLDEGRRLAPEGVVQVRHAHAPQLEHVAEPGRGDERRTRSAVLQHGVRRHRRPVDDLVGAAERPHGVDDGAVVVGRRGEDLLDADPPVRVGEDDVGERATDVGADPPHSRSDGSSSQIRSTAHCIDSWMTLCAAFGSPALQASRNRR
jgi:hypothetical protein